MKRKIVKTIVFALIWVGALILIGAMGLWENNACSDGEFFIRSIFGALILLIGVGGGYIDATLRMKRYKKSLKYRRAMEKLQINKMSA